uniref:Uncharacterized protein n=1 Tax=Anguilla anguilla TaxID=7936 RepID=A0A0E9VGE9_ANGAN
MNLLTWCIHDWIYFPHVAISDYDVVTTPVVSFVYICLCCVCFVFFW